ncbi:MAG: Gfo/Idh/MocA family oxidoreductase [Chloroflexi bacterium]|nr:Gfo/Idh/MocA family oxidoreductase [Chloroflexota bacterium]
MAAPVIAGLVGAGPWAQIVHAPMLAAGPETELAGIWARNPESAKALAAKHGVRAFARYDDLLAACEAVAFAVAPSAQPELAIAAAKAGKALLLEKPLAADLEGATLLAETVESCGVPSLLMLSYRFADGMAKFLEGARASRPIGARAAFLSSGFRSGPFAQGWRLERGALLDVGPHMIDLVSAALGPVVAVKAHGDPVRWAGLLLQHEGGATSEVTLSASLPIATARTELEVFGEGGSRFIDARAGTGPHTFAAIRATFACLVRDGGPHELDAGRGLYLQRVVAAAEEQLRPQTAPRLPPLPPPA